MEDSPEAVMARVEVTAMEKISEECAARIRETTFEGEPSDST
jgi:hypothetical protein